MTWLSRRLLGGGPVSSDADGKSEASPDKLKADGRLLERLTVTEEGTELPIAGRGEFRGEFRGVLRGVLCGGGSFDRAEWTRSSIFCIRLRRLFIWWSDSDRAIAVGWKLVRVLGGFIDLASEAAVLLPEAIEGTLVCLEDADLAP